MQTTPTSESRLSARIRVSSEVLLLRIMYATAIVVLYPVLDAWWATRSEVGRSITYGDGAALLRDVPVARPPVFVDWFSPGCSYAAVTQCTQL
jgi:hypothetical protein